MKKIIYSLFIAVLSTSLVQAEVKPISESAFQSEVLNKQGVVVVDFYADWCAPCKAMMPILQSVTNQLEAVSIVKVNIDTAKAIAKKYDIQSIPTFIWFKDGKEVDRKVGSLSEQDFLSRTKKNL